jgi:hypothetical protein
MGIYFLSEKKITSIGSQVKIKAARGLGYSLEKDNA